MAYHDAEELGGKGFFLTNVTAAVISVLVIALLVAEGG